MPDEVTPTAGQAPEASTTPVVDTPSADASTTTTTPEATAETFPREYVEQLREEAARYRNRAKEYDDVYGSYDEESRGALLDIARQLADPNTQPAAAKRLMAIAQKIEESQANGTPTRPDGEEDPDARPLTKREWEQLQTERDNKAAEDRAIAQLEDEAKALGYEPGSAEYFFLLDKAQLPDVSGDLNKAHELVEQFFADKAAERARRVEEKAGRWPGVAGSAPNTGAADPDAKPITDFKAARRSAMARLAASRQR